MDEASGNPQPKYKVEGMRIIAEFPKPKEDDDIDMVAEVERKQVRPIGVHAVGKMVFMESVFIFAPSSFAITSVWTRTYLQTRMWHRHVLLMHCNGQTLQIVLDFFCVHVVLKA